ncbi:2'-5' RNA ligase family protein [Pengzhenrongella sicca]|uniref:2'-5' RNA ligase family protein n=1 Tax=Pengzhenrongella sicca TaxID=2819238 RepID=A0A8A4ZBM0_9MICO|nr:2'-5' RNA ligase family protein [Pengzhenrongella sicca]QTE28805.1 2'-5' RNA ligase family protein [Pengzhenrongella sicca]
MILPERSGSQLRIGVAITVPEPYGSTLQHARGRFGDPLAGDIPPHITLLGPTVVEPRELADISAHLARVAAATRPFVFQLRGTGSFRPVSPVVFVQVDEGAPECARLEAAVRSGPLAQDVRFDYHPHVTVAHEVPDAALDRAFAEMAQFQARFVVSGFQFFEHGDDNVWRPVRDFLFTGSSARPRRASGSAPFARERTGS